MPHDNFSVIYSGNIVQADLLKCLLEGKGIAARLEDEFLGKMVPYAAAAGGAGAGRSRPGMLIEPPGLFRISSRTAKRDMNYQVVGFVFAFIGAVTGIVWIVFAVLGLRRLRDIRDHLTQLARHERSDASRPQK